MFAIILIWLFVWKSESFQVATKFTMCSIPPRLLSILISILIAFECTEAQVVPGGQIGQVQPQQLTSACPILAAPANGFFLFQCQNIAGFTCSFGKCIGNGSN